MDRKRVCNLIQDCDPERVELAQHVFERARRRNADVSGLREKILECDFEEVRENNRSDPDFDHSYRVKLYLDDTLVEVPI